MVYFNYLRIVYGVLPLQNDYAIFIFAPSKLMSDVASSEINYSERPHNVTGSRIYYKKTPVFFTKTMSNKSQIFVSTNCNFVWMASCDLFSKRRVAGTVLNRDKTQNMMDRNTKSN